MFRTENFFHSTSDDLVVTETIGTLCCTIEIRVHKAAIGGGPEQRQPIRRIIENRLDLGPTGPELTMSAFGKLLQLLIQFAQSPSALGQCRRTRLLVLAAASAVDRDAVHAIWHPVRSGHCSAEKDNPMGCVTGPNEPGFDANRTRTLAEFRQSRRDTLLIRRMYSR